MNAINAPVAVDVSVSRRAFLQGSVCLTFAVLITGSPGDAFGATPAVLNAWITINPDDTIDIISPAAEGGNGSYTALPLIVAEELDADWAKVNAVAPMGLQPTKYGNPAFGGALYTSGSTTVQFYFTPLRIAGAQARRVLLDSVAAHWSVPVSELSTEPSFVVHKASGRRISYGKVAEFASVPEVLPIIEAKDLKPAGQFRLIGKDVGRIEVPQKVNGTAKYGMDVQIPGMVYAAVLQSPYLGGAPAEVDDVEARKVPGVTNVVKLPGAVGVVGTTVEATQQGRLMLKVRWSDAEGAHYSTENIYEEYSKIAQDKSREGYAWDKAGDVDAALASAHKIYRREYRTQHLCHAQMEPVNATAVVAPDGSSVDIYCGSQAMTNGIVSVASALKIDPKNVRIHQHLLGGGFGRRTQHEAAVDAALIAKAVGKPVKLIWTRDEDIQAGKFFPLLVHYEEAGVDMAGNIIAWRQRVVGESALEYIRPGALKASGKEAVVMKTTELRGYDVPNRLAEFIWERKGTRLAAYRGVGAAPNRFAIESFLDEIALDLKKDPVDFRLQITRDDPKAQLLIRTVAEMSKWGRTMSKGSGLGIAYITKDDTRAAGVAEVQVSQSTGEVKVVNFWAAVDAGLAVQPFNAVAQMEGGIIFGLGRTLMEEITIKDGRVEQANYSDYLVPRMADIPNIEVKVLNTDSTPVGIGEDGVPLVAPAVANAVFAASGLRLRQLPLSPALLKGRGA
jgi:isoquinoline 1-oxidoreductase subunit beta